jgi:hypothetical protein
MFFTLMFTDSDVIFCSHIQYVSCISCCLILLILIIPITEASSQENKQEQQRIYNVTLSRVCATIVAVEKQ